MKVNAECVVQVEISIYYYYLQGLEDRD